MCEDCILMVGFLCVLVAVLMRSFSPQTPNWLPRRHCLPARTIPAVFCFQL